MKETHKSNRSENTCHCNATTYSTGCFIKCIIFHSPPCQHYLSLFEFRFIHFIFNFFDSFHSHSFRTTSFAPIENEIFVFCRVTFNFCLCSLQFSSVQFSSLQCHSNIFKIHVLCVGNNRTEMKTEHHITELDCPQSFDIYKYIYLSHIANKTKKS